MPITLTRNGVSYRVRFSWQSACIRHENNVISRRSVKFWYLLIVAGNDHYLAPLADRKDGPGLLDKLLEPWQGRADEATLIFLPEDLPGDGSEPDPELAIARGFEVSRPQTTVVDGKRIVWEERLLVIRSFSYVETMHRLKSFRSPMRSWLLDLLDLPRTLYTDLQTS